MSTADYPQERAPGRAQQTVAVGSTGVERNGVLERAVLPLARMDLAIREQWSELVRTTAADLSIAPAWFSSTVGALGVEDRANLYALFADRRLVAAAPYVDRVERFFGIGARSRELAGSYLVAYHPEIVASIDVDAALEQLLHDSAGACDVVFLPNLDKTGSTAAAVRRVTAKLYLQTISRAGHASPYLTIGTDWESFLKSKPKKFRYKVRNATMALEEVGTVTNRWFGSAQEIDELIAAILRVEANSWKAAAGMAITNRQTEDVYHRMLLPFLAAERALQANIVYLNDEPIAYSLCYVTNRRVRQLKTSFDQRYAERSAGAAATLFAVEKAFRDGAIEFDFLGDTMPHKMQWASAIREHESMYVFLRSWRGRIVGRGRKLAAKVKRLVKRRREPD